MHSCTAEKIIADADAIVSETDRIILKHINRALYYSPAPGHNFQVYNYLDDHCGVWKPRLFCTKCGETKTL